MRCKQRDLDAGCVVTHIRHMTIKRAIINSKIHYLEHLYFFTFSAIVAGWGKDVSESEPHSANILKKAYLRIISMNYCAKKLSVIT
jgi:hypothetical protein